MSETVMWEQVVNAKLGDMFVDRFDEGLRFIILRGPFHLCAYVGVPEAHPMAEHDYDSLPIDCHGGLTFSRAGDGKYLPKGYWWYGWDYGHCDDYRISDHHSTNYKKLNETRTKWGVKEVDGDSRRAIYGFKKLLALTEKIAGKYLMPRAVQP